MAAGDDRMTAWKDMGMGLRALLIGGGAAAAAVVAAVAVRESPVPEPVVAVAPAEEAAPEAPDVVPDVTPTEVAEPVAETATAPEPAAEVAAAEPVEEAAAPAPEQTEAEAAAQPPAAQLPVAVAPTFDVVRVAPDGATVIAGNAEAGAVVSVKIDGAEVATASADGGGAFVSLFDLEPSATARVVTLSARKPGGEALASVASVLIAPVEPPAADLPAPEPAEAEAAPAAAPETEPVELATSEPEPEPEAPTTVLLTDEGAKVLQPAEAEPAVARNVTIDAISYSSAGDVQLSGRGAPDAAVRVYVDNRAVLDTRIAPDGAWAATLPQLAAGVYALRADELNAEGRVMSRYETPFQREAPAVLAAAAGAGGQKALKITVQPGFTLWRIARESYGDGVMYVRVYDANKDQIRDPDLIYPGQVFTVPSEE
jgi:nucleoid-associated protein YgaU